jgi:hypothetical protein
MARPDHIAPAPYAEIRNPLCVAARGSTRSAQYEVEQGARILELEGQLANARARLHDANNDLTAASGALQMIATLLGLPDTARPARVVDAVLARLR